MKSLALTLLLAAFAGPALAGECPYTDNDRARWTHADMMSWKIALAAYKQDNGKYPEAKTLAEARAAVEPKYIAHAPMTDAWGLPYSYEGDANDFKIVSAGADGKFDRESWSQAGRGTSYNDDALVTGSGRWLTRYWDLSK